MSFKCLPFSRSIIVDVIHAIVSRPITRPSTRQPLLLSKTAFHSAVPRNKSSSKGPLDTRDKQIRAQYQTMDADAVLKNAQGKTLTVNRYKIRKPLPPRSHDFYQRRIYECIQEQRINRAIQYIREMEHAKLKPNVNMYSMIISGYCKQSDMEKAKSWLNRMLKNKVAPDAYIYTSIIDGYMGQANIDGAEFAFKSMMKRDIKPTSVTYNILMHHSAKKLDMDSALKFWGNLLSAGIKSDVYTFAILLHGLGKADCVDEAWRIYNTMQEEGVDVNEVVITTLMGMHVKQRDNQYAIGLFNEFFGSQSKHGLPVTDHTRNVLLNSVLAQAEDSETIKQHYTQYQRIVLQEEDEKVEPTSLFKGANVFTYTSFMRAFLRRSDATMVSQVYSDMIQQKIKPTLVTYSTLMLAHAFIPDPDSCQRMLEELKKGDIKLNAVVYTIVMRAWAKAGRWDKVKDTYELMKQDDIQPTKVTMEVLRHAGAKSGNT